MKNQATNYFNLSPNDQNEILQTSFQALNKFPQVLEKDIWICWTLEKLFSMPNAHPMAFKGGTSLSKVSNLIERFSEDVDITIDYKSFNTDDPFDPSTSNTKRKKISDQLKLFLKDYVTNEIAPYLKSCIENEFAQPIQIEVSDDGEKLHVHYPSVCELRMPYIKSYVFIEFGARNVTEPNTVHTVQPDIAPHVKELNLSCAQVNVLNPERTFWEKATLIHVECNRGKFKENAQRLSRHWYDLAMLHQSQFGHTAIQNKALLTAVVNHKKAFFNESNANYDHCLQGKFNLIPTDEQLTQLQLDYERMTNSNMFYGKLKPFNEIILTTKSLLETVNNQQ
ncbi:MAG: nucleotidyl transferase AbiEii/AbiGii toxin family protein [Proteobacteria bacterium]|nr:nucleotidyl transferase AbiEii/AbiGii toxin family protein [Pseudomonadota bacterium]